MDLIKLLLVLTIASIIPGQIIRIPIGSLATVTVSDVLTLVTITIFTVHSFAVKKRLVVPRGIITLLLVFSLIAATATILASSRFTLNQIISAVFFHIRFLAYFLISIVTLNVISKDQTIKLLNLIVCVGIIFTVIGFLQFIFVPNLLFLAPLGWDPHQKRLVSTLLDPNFAGGVLVILSSVSAALFLFEKKRVYLAATALFFVGILLTFSRSSYLALFVSLAIIGFLKSPKFMTGVLSLFVLAVIINTQARQRVVGALTFDETSQARIESWTKAITIFSENPVFGVGFNTYRYAQSQYGFFNLDEPLGGHSGAGSDSSLLLIAATTGTIGISTFVLFIVAVLKKVVSQSSKNCVGLAALSALCAILVHSQFVNSLFYPQMMLLIWLIFGLSYASKNN